VKRVIFLDWYNTLSQSVYWGHLATADPTLHATVRSALFDANVHMLVPWMLGRLTTEQVLACVAATAGLRYDWVLSEFIVGCECMAFVSPEVPRLVAQIRQAGVRVLIATDNMDAFTRWTVPALNLRALFDGVLNSCDLGAMKNDLGPDGRSLFFARYLAEHDLAPCQCLLIDDSADTHAAMHAIGMPYRHVTSPNQIVDILVAVAQEVYAQVAEANVRLHK
jgi:FMN phosphatase YigB (HAD superfamily)